MSALSGVTVVVTRPAHQAENLCRLIQAAGGEVIRFPVIEIGPAEDPQKCQAQLAELADIDLVIFISANAVNAAVALQPMWPDNLAIAAVGRATAQALAAKHIRVTHIAPVPFNSEALLSLPELENLQGKRVLIIRGNGGREFLRKRLLERAAVVDYVECYQRSLPKTETTALYQAWQEKKTLPIVVTSNQGLENLQSMINAEHQLTLLAAPLFLVSERTAALSRKLGFTQCPVVAATANDDAILTTLNTWAKA